MVVLGVVESRILDLVERAEVLTEDHVRRQFR
jgi:hypothetical protein